MNYEWIWTKQGLELLVTEQKLDRLGWKTTFDAAESILNMIIVL